eukprot:2073539-Amphidinium_carterae.1
MAMPLEQTLVRGFGRKPDVYIPNVSSYAITPELAYSPCSPDRLASQIQHLASITGFTQTRSSHSYLSHSQS